MKTYCVSCSAPLIERELDNKLYCFCCSCGKIFSRNGSKYSCILELSGNNSIREFLASIDNLTGGDKDANQN